MDAAQQSAHIIPLVRKLRDAGVPPPAAEAIGETMEQVATKSELRAELDAMEKRVITQMRLEIRAAISDAMLKIVLAMIAVQGLGVAVIVLLLK